MLRLSIVIFFGILLSLLLSSCDSQEKQNDFVDDARSPPSGITSTDRDGIIVSEDEDDWRTAPFYFGKVRIDPAYPNPSFGQIVTVPVSILEFNAIQGGLVLRADDGDDHLLLLAEILNAAQPGAYVLRFSPVILGRTGLIRLLVFDRLGELVSYGDIKIQ